MTLSSEHKELWKWNIIMTLSSDEIEILSWHCHMIIHVHVVLFSGLQLPTWSWQNQGSSKTEELCQKRACCTDR
jgi:hypothetical protein